MLRKAIVEFGVVLCDRETWTTTMGCALSTAEKDAVQRSLAIDKSLASEGAFRQNEIKLLLLGK